MNHPAESHCGDCKHPSPKLFMVQDEPWVWHIAGPGLLCLHCAEQRPGRPFQESDFSSVRPMTGYLRPSAPGCGRQLQSN